MGKHLVFVGGGHAHLTSLVNVRDYIRLGHRISLISPVTHHYYSGMGPGLLSGIYRPEEVRFHIKKLVEDRGASFVKGYVTRINAGKRLLFLDSGEEVSYDLVSFNTGSGVPLNEVSDDNKNVYPVKPIVNLLKARKKILEMIRGEIPRLLVVGGGPAGVELSGNLWRLVHDNGGQAGITLVAGGSLLSLFPGKARNLAIASLRERGVEVVEGAQVSRFADGWAVLADGRRLPYDIVFAALGVKPSQVFRESGLPTDDDGGLLVNEHLQSVAHPEIFGGGDCISLQGSHLDKVGVYAVRQNEILHHNLLSAFSGEPMEKFAPQGTYLLIFNLGDGTGIFVRRSWVWSGRLAFLFKDYLDRSFMRKFQVSGEREDRSEVLH
ncbi:MAG: NAD(P)/FAD-dependent oxidoreductase [Desulfomonilaceae bacterium]